MMSAVPRIALGAVFLISGATKLVDFDATWRVFEAAAALPRSVAVFGVGLLVLGELGLGGAMLLRLLADRTAAAVSLVVLPAATAGAGAMAASGVENCGCFGTLLPVTPAATLVKNVVLLLVAAWLWRLSTPADVAAAPSPPLGVTG